MMRRGGQDEEDSGQEEEASESEEEAVEGEDGRETSTLDLSLEEVRHIRTALSRAELEVGVLLLLRHPAPGFARHCLLRPPLLLLQEHQVNLLTFLLPPPPTGLVCSVVARPAACAPD